MKFRAVAETLREVLGHEWAAAHDSFVEPSVSSMIDEPKYDRYAEAVRVLRAALTPREPR